MTAAAVAASGAFGRPCRPTLPGSDDFTGPVAHAADYRSPVPFAGRRVVVVGAGNPAVQIAAQLAQVTR
ncbi:NAD(P)-binding domain-containing protein [Streptomyces luteogriseus]|uniref:NAD(P)-binding domain-containing protein n=1 Tax=Streptomyces luteogriseus TaxID=68233 RepID=UPI003820D08B